MKDYKDHTIESGSTVRTALVQLDKIRGETLFVLDSDAVLVATLTDGDIRRALVNGADLTDPVSKVMNTSFSFITEVERSKSVLATFRDRDIRFVPILDSNKRIVEVLDLREKRALLPIDAIIMAGGKGMRLRPLTEHTPKPLLKIGDKPIIEYNIDRLGHFGVDNIHISINYLGEQLVEYFGDGKSRGQHIYYVEENEPLGTIGSASMIAHCQNDYVLVMNSDLLTNIDYEELFNTLVESNADLVMATVPYEVQVPYAVMELEDTNVRSFVEKPTYTYYSNAGIYLFRKEVLDMIPKNQVYNATDLIEDLIAKGKQVKSYPILGYWLDIGKPEDYNKAQSDIKRIRF